MLTSHPWRFDGAVYGIPKALDSAASVIDGSRPRPGGYAPMGRGARHQPPHFRRERFYLASNPDVAAAGVNPLVHYVTAGRAERRAAFAPRTLASGRLTGYVPPQGRLPWFNPLNLVVAPRLVNEPRLNVLVPGLAMRHLSGGPNTALEIAGRLALSGVRVRLISTEVRVR